MITDFRGGTFPHKNYLRAIRTYEGVMCKTLSHHTCIPLQTLRYYELGICSPPVDRALRIANYLGYTVEEIWGSEVPEYILELEGKN